jgi:hypothetical protein
MITERAMLAAVHISIWTAVFSESQPHRTPLRSCPKWTQSCAVESFPLIIRGVPGIDCTAYTSIGSRRCCRPRFDFVRHGVRDGLYRPFSLPSGSKVGLLGSSVAAEGAVDSRCLRNSSARRGTRQSRMKDRTSSGRCSTTSRDSLYVPFRDLGLRECANVSTPKLSLGRQICRLADLATLFRPRMDRHRAS